MIIAILKHTPKEGSKCRYNSESLVAELKINIENCKLNINSSSLYKTYANIKIGTFDKNSGRQLVFYAGLILC